MGSNEIYTIGREFGSLGKQVGQDLAKRLGFFFFDFVVFLFYFLLNFLSFHQTHSCEAMKRLEYVPAAMPTIIGMEKLRIELTPKQ